MINILKKVKDLWPLFLLVLCVFYFVFIFLNAIVRDYILDNNAKIIVGVVISERNYNANDKISKSFTYSYEFVFEGEKYRKNSSTNDLRIGDSILIECYPKFPYFNRSFKNKR